MDLEKAQIIDGKKCVLIVEPDAAIRNLIVGMIEQDGHSVYSAATAGEALDVLSRSPVELIITDINLPDLAPVDFIRGIRNIFENIPVIAVAEDQEATEVQELISSGIYAFLRKPIVETDVVPLVVRNALARDSFSPDGKYIKRYSQDPGDFINEIVTAKQEWESAVDFIGRIVMLVDRDKRICRCNRALCNITGMHFTELLRKKWDEVLRDAGFVPMPGDFHQSPGVEFYSEGKKQWLLVQMFPFFEIVREAGSLVRQVITFHDITELKRATDEVRRQKEKIRTQNIALQSNEKTLKGALDQLSHLIFEVERTGSFNIRFENPNLVSCSSTMKCRNTECPCFGAENVRCWQIAGTHCNNSLQKNFSRKFQQCEECPVFKEATSNPIFRIGEHFNNMMNMLERKNNEVEEAYQRLKLTQGQILQQEKMASIGQLAAGIAHEINNPMGFIMSNLNSLTKYVNRLTDFIRIQNAAFGTGDESTDPIREYRKTAKIDFIIDDIGNLIQESFEGAERVKRIVQDLKSFSRIDEAELKMADLNAGLESTINIVWNELKYKAALHKEYGDIPMTKCNAGHLNQVFMNLLMNAAQAIEKRGDITVRTWRDESHINVSISDTGCGIPEDKISRIFEPFFTTKEVGKGTGLGLSIAYDIIHKHNGYLGVDSVPGEGTTFTIKLPIVES